MELIIRNKIINEPVINILKKLKEDSHREIFHDINNKGEYVQVTCPYHKNGQEHKPSCSVYAKRDNDKFPMGTFHCFRAGTKVPTSEGIKDIETLVGKKVKIINGNGDWEEVEFKCYGTAELYKINLCRENITNSIYCTSNHEWFVNKKSGTKSTIELTNKDYLESKYPIKKDFNLIEEAIIHGIIYADGTRVQTYKSHRIKDSNLRTYDKEHPNACCYSIYLSKKTSKINLVKYFEGNPNWTIDYNAIKEGKEYIRISSKRFNLYHNYKKLPDLYLGRDYLMSFLAGYFSCDGSIKGKSFSTTKYQDMLQLRDLFISCGIPVRNLVTLIRKPGSTYLKNKESILYTTKVVFEVLPDAFFINEKPDFLKNKKYLRGRWKVSSVEKTDLIEPVYCCETSTESFVIDENILTHNCFTCGKSSNLQRLVADCLEVDYKEAEDWLLDNYGNTLVSEAEVYFDPIEIPNEKEEYKKLKNLKNNFLPEEELNKYEFDNPRALDYLINKRHLSKNVIDFFKIGYNKANDSIIFPVRNITGNLVGIYQRSIENKKFVIPELAKKPVYLLDTAIKYNYKTIFVAESQINALTLWSWGYPAVALFGTGSSDQYNILKKSGILNFVLCFDGDSAGYHGRCRFMENMPTSLNISYIDVPAGKDINDLTKEQFEYIFTNNMK